MRLAVLPFNASEGTKPAYGRQFVNFCSDIVRTTTDTEINAVSYLTQMEEDGTVRAAFVNLADSMIEPAQIREMFDQFQVDVIVDGSLRLDDLGHFEMTVRTHRREEEAPAEERAQFKKEELFENLVTLTERIAAAAETTVPTDKVNVGMFGTDNPEVFLKFLEGYDALMYIQQSNGQVAKEFSPDPSIDALLEAFKMDDGFLAPYETLVQVCRACANYRIGSFEKVEAALNELVELADDEYPAYMALGELYQMVNQPIRSSEFYEKAVAIAPEEPALWVRLGMAQMSMNMPVNAERNFRKALELEDETKPSMDYLAGVLAQTNRAHEVPTLWKELLEKNPGNAEHNVKYAMSLWQIGQEDDAQKAFETALETVEENAMVKRYYAPILAQKGDLDRAMDFYEDCLDVAPADIDLNLEYAGVLEQADRAFEVPQVLRNVLGVAQDPNVRAEVTAKLIELEQPKRAEAVEAARAKMEAGDFDTAVRELKPLKSWLADYWKLWALLSAAHNRLEQYDEAEEAAKKLLELYPGCEPGYGELMAALGATGRHEEAYSVMRFAGMRMPNSIAIHLNLALAAKRSGRDDEAKNLAKALREAVGPNEDLEPVFREIES